MSDLAHTRRQLRIKSGVVKRLSKEHKLYIVEAEAQQRKLDKFIADGAEQWDINNGGRMMDESKKMIKDSESRLGKAVGELADLIALAKKETELAGDADLLKAEEILGESEANP